MEQDIRWKQRFQNFDRAFCLLKEALADGPDSLSQLEKEGVVQRFEYSFELAWKMVKDYMELQGVTITPISPRQTIKEAFAGGFISDGEILIEMLNHRNLLSHNYDGSVFAEAVEAIAKRYLAPLERLHESFARKVQDDL